MNGKRHPLAKLTLLAALVALLTVAGTYVAADWADAATWKPDADNSIAVGMAALVGMLVGGVSGALFVGLMSLRWTHALLASTVGFVAGLSILYLALSDLDWQTAVAFIVGLTMLEVGFLAVASLGGLAMRRTASRLSRRRHAAARPSR